MQYVFILITIGITVSMAINYQIAAAAMFFIGASLVWIGFYQGISGLIHARGKSRVMITLVQATLAAGGFALLFFSDGVVGLFGKALSAVQYGYISAILGMVLGFTAKPPPEEITAVQD